MVKRRNRSEKLVELSLEPDPSAEGGMESTFDATNPVEVQVAEGAKARRLQAKSDLKRDQIVYGIVRTPEQRRIFMKERVQFLEDLDRLHYASVDLHRMKLEQHFEQSDLQKSLESQRHQELVDTIERGNVVAKVRDFAMAHPFLAGFFGSALFGRAGRRRQ